MIKGRHVHEMTPDERLDALAEILAIGFEKVSQKDDIQLAEARKAMAPCVHAVNGRRPAAGAKSND